MPFVVIPARPPVHKGAPKAEAWRAIRAVADRYLRPMIAALEQAFADLGDAIDLDALQEAVESGHVRAVLDAIDFAKLQQLLIQPIAILNHGFLEASAIAGQQLLQQILQPAAAQGAKPKLRRHGELIIVEAVGPSDRGDDGLRGRYRLRFNEANPAALRWASRNAGRFITEISDETRAGIQELVGRALNDGWAPRDLARLIRDQGIGLTRPQAQALLNYRQRLVADGAKPERIAQLTDRKSKQQIKYRSEVIASHELLSASNSGQSLLWREAVRTDLLGAATKRKWIITPDDRLCPLCAQMRGERAITGMDEPWSTPRGDVMIPQGIHVRCRCAQGLVIDEPGGGRARFRAALADPSSELLEILEVEAE
jgi:hypothetical protein